MKFSKNGRPVCLSISIQLYMGLRGGVPLLEPCFPLLPCPYLGTAFSLCYPVEGSLEFRMYPPLGGWRTQPPSPGRSFGRAPTIRVLSELWLSTGEGGQTAPGGKGPQTQGGGSTLQIRGGPGPPNPKKRVSWFPRKINFWQCFGQFLQKACRHEMFGPF